MVLFNLRDFYVKDLNHIYVSSYVYSGLMRVDTTCHIIQKFPMELQVKGIMYFHHIHPLRIRI